MFENICRLCGLHKGVIFIFDNFNTNGLSPYQKITYFCDKSLISFDEEEDLPKFICLNCDNELSSCYAFLVKCANTEKTLREEKNNPEYNLQEDTILSEEESISIKDVEKKHVKEQLNGYKPKCIVNKKSLNICKQIKHIKEKERHETQISKQESKKKLNKCLACHKSFLNMSLLIEHIDKTHPNESLYDCPQCSKMFKNPLGLKKHKDTHLSIKKYMCDYCGKACCSKQSLMIHMRIHTGETPFKCSFCFSSFSQRGQMKIHTLRHHTHEKPYQCNKCSKGFVTRNELRAHSDTHNVEKKYNCTTCNRLFRAKGNLYQHQRRHRNKRRVFICDHCDFEFTYKANLAKHISRMHTSNSGFCKTCSMNVSQFEEHMKKHRGDRPFDCESCPKTFLDKRGLHYHINLKHTKTDHYKCEKDSCSLAFPSMRMLNYHILKVHGNGTPYKCGICPRGFYRKSDYHRHKSGTHKQYLQDETVV